MRAWRVQPSDRGPLELTILLDRKVAGVRDGEVEAGRTCAATLDDALGREWPSDAHICQYEPCEAEDGTVIRRTIDDGGPPVVMRALLGDLDDPIAHAEKTPAREEWRAEMLPRVEATGLAYYETRGGYRVVGRLAEPFTIASRADGERWRRAYRAWAKSTGLPLDLACSDWGRCFRLPNVVREGVGSVRADVVGAVSVIRLGATPVSPLDDTALERAYAIASEMPESIEGRGGDAALFDVTNALAEVLGEDATAIEALLVGVFNPRCLPPWPRAKLAREAQRAAKRQGSPEARLGRRLAAARAPAAIVTHDSESDWTSDDPPVEWISKALGLAPNDDKISLLAGLPSAGKGPFAGMLAIHACLGRPWLDCDFRRVRVGILDFEGATRTRRRIRGFCQGLGIDPRELEGRLFLRRAESSDEINHVRAWVEERELGLLIVDSYTSALLGLGVDANTPEYAGPARTLSFSGVCTLVIAHGRKPAAARKGEAPSLSDVAGSFALGAMAQTAISIWRPHDADPLLARVSCLRTPDEPFRAFDVRWSVAEGIWTAARVDAIPEARTRAAPSVADDSREIDRTANEVLGILRACPGAALPIGKVWSDVREAVGLANTDKGAVLRGLESLGLIRCTGAGRGRHVSLTPAGAPASVGVVFAGRVATLTRGGNVG